MMTMERAIERGLVPLSLAKGALFVCKCGGAILINENLTERRCSNRHCFQHMAERGAALFQHFGYKGIGVETCKYIIRLYNLQSHFDLLDPDLYLRNTSGKDEVLRAFALQPRRVRLHELAQLAFLPGLQSSAFELFASYSSFTEYFAQFPDAFDEYTRNMLVRAERYFNILPGMSQRVIEVMLTHTIKGYSNRCDFIRGMNELFGSVVALKLVRKKATADYLVCDDPNARGEQITLALGKGIPILTSEEFIEEIVRKYFPSQAIYK